jgi:predicted nucleotidyltransferase component of viral defense system
MGATMNFTLVGLGKQQTKVLGQLSGFTRQHDYYLAGGTALSLYFGHRKSVDLDWFTGESMGDALVLAGQIKRAGIPFETVQTARGTLHGMIRKIRVTFLEFRYPLLESLTESPDMNFRLASLDDLACMKLSALAQRGARKDFCDIYALGIKHRPLNEMLALYCKKFKVQDFSPVLLGLAYFDDAEKERMPAMLWDVDWGTIKKTIQGWLKLKGFNTV